MRNKILKFRAWDGLNKKFTYWTMNDLCTYSEKDEKPNALDDWQQDTGLLDRHGKEIYEGDIVHSVYKYEDTNSNWVISWKDGDMMPFNRYYDNPNRDLEVLGNIYENPELLQDNLLS